MQRILVSAALAMALGAMLSPIGANAAGCVKGAVVGGVAGHVAGHHTVLGAAAGCAVGHHEAAKHAREDREQAQHNGPSNSDDNR
ncbi:MAG TPA: hypothetical protein VGL95_10550 [Acetobacteraceae bacterium]|jgi:hypothetical protein